MAQAGCVITLSIDMIEKTFVYGDSFSDHEFINSLANIKHDEMWYAQFVEGDLTARTRSGKCPQTMFLQATHDAIIEQKPVRMIVALGVCERLTVYTDGWYDKESLKEHDPTTPLPMPARRTTLTDCEQYFAQAAPNRHNTQQFHPTLIWANIFKGILDLHLLCKSRGHQLLLLHMNATPDSVWINKRHPLIRPLCEHAESLHNYLGEQHSCHELCRQQQIRPLDYDKYGWQGHHGREGQRHFTAEVRSMLAERNIWN